MTDATHDPALPCWVESANRPETPFPIQNLPYASFRRHGSEQVRFGVAIGDMVLDAELVFEVASLAAVFAMPRVDRRELRRRFSRFLSVYSDGADRWLISASELDLLLPRPILDYTDFYASIDHATNVGRIFRPGRPLFPNYKWVPIAYQGRASSVVISGTPIRRPWGQISTTPEGPPVYAPTRMLDYELEIGALLGPGTALGEPVPIGRAEDHVVGVCLLNDWSARDIQVWESQPLGPFLSKSFATSLSPWVITLEALEPFRCPARARSEGDPAPLPYLSGPDDGGFHITLEVWLRTAEMQEPVRVSRGNFDSMYWTLAQMVSHLTSNGCPLRPGGLVGSGTVSGAEKPSRGCLLEMTERGADPLVLNNGELREFLEDGDEVILRGYCEAPGFRRIGLGECRGVVLPALALNAPS